MNCPHCQQPIDPALIRKAANSDAGSRPRPGASGLVRNGCKHDNVTGRITGPSSTLYFCDDCNREVKLDAKKNKWRLVRKQKSPAD